MRQFGSSFSGLRGAQPPVAIQRARIRISREGSAASYSHLKQIEAIRKAVELSAWPASKTQGKKPKVKIAFGPAVSVGYLSEAEYADVELMARLDQAKAKEDLQKQLPDGFKVMAIKTVPRFFPSLEETINAARVELTSKLFLNTRGKWEEFWKASHFPVVKKKQDREEVIDARQLVISWTLEEDKLNLVFRFGPGKTLKAERIAQAVCGLADAQVEMGGAECAVQVRRMQLFLEKQSGELIEP